MAPPSMLTLACLALTGLVHCDHSAAQLGYPTEVDTRQYASGEVTAPLGYPLEGYDTAQATTGGGYYSGYPTTGVGGQYDFNQVGTTDIDRQGEVISMPVILIAVGSALLGALIAPLIAQIGFQLTTLTSDIELPQIPGFDNRFIKNRSKHQHSSPLLTTVAKGFKKFLQG